jgi:multifunctional beta-oxidation protein
VTGGLFESLVGWAGEIRWQRTGGYGFSTKKTLTPETIISKWAAFTDFGAFQQK